MISKTVTLIKDYYLNGVLKRKGLKLTVDKAKCQELANGGYIETDKRYKAKRPTRSKVNIKKAVVTASENTNIKNK